MGIVDISVNQAGLNSLDMVNTILFNFPGKAQVATWRAAKRAGAAGKTEAKRYVTKVYNIKPSQFSKYTTTKVHQEGGGGGTTKLIISYSGKLLELLEFKPAVSIDGVRYQMKRGNEVHLRHAFDIPAYGGHIFERVGKPRFPIRKKYGISTPHMLRDDEVADALGKRIMEIFNRRLSHEIGQILGKY